MLYRYAIIVVFLLLNSFTADAADFRKLVPVMNNYRSGAGGDISMRVAAQSFEIRKAVWTAIDSAQGEALAARATGSLPILKMAEGGNWIEYELDRDTLVQRAISADGTADSSRRWIKRSTVRVGSYPNSDWQSFIAFSIAHGLSGVEETRYGGRSFHSLWFSAVAPGTIDTGRSKLVVPDAFSSVMRVSPSYPAKAGSKGFVILLHDPHANVAGRYQTLSGLRALLSANSDPKVRFLVEGAYEGPSRAIEPSALDRVLAANASTTPAVVHSMLSSYLINVPLAYRLLYGRSIELYAIDNNELLKYDAPRSIRSVGERMESVSKIAVALKSANVPEQMQAGKTALSNALLVSLVYLRANVADVHGQAIIDYFDALAKLTQDIVRRSEELRRGGMELSRTELASIEADRLGYAEEADVYRKALARNDTLSKEIIGAASAGNDLPIAFIGSYHTAGIVAELQQASIGYIVLEPRPRARTTMADERRFDDANHGNTRQAYLGSNSFNMGYVAPSGKEISKQIAPKISVRASEIESARQSFRNEFREIPGNNVNLPKLESALNGNGTLAVAGVAPGGRYPPPPGKFDKAFAYFEPGRGGNGAGNGGGSGGGTLFLAHPDDPKWNGSGRYQFLSAAVFKEPAHDGGMSPGVLLAFYPESTSKRLYTTYYDPASKRIYCFEGQPSEAAQLVPLPIGGETKEQNIRSQIVQIFIPKRRVQNG